MKGCITLSHVTPVALHYLKTPSGFSLDIIAALPYEIIALPIPTQSTCKTVLLYIWMNDQNFEDGGRLLFEVVVTHY